MEEDSYTSDKYLEESNETEDSQEEEIEEENENNEENKIKNALEEVSFGEILKAKQKIENHNIKTVHENKEITKKKSYLKNKFEEINRNKDKSSPKESSALIKPSLTRQYVNKFSSQHSSVLKRDPRFDDLSGGKSTFEAALKKYDFVEEKAVERLRELGKLRKKKDIKLTDDEVDKINYQKGQLKDFLSRRKSKKIEIKIKKDITNRNTERVKEGKSKIYFKEKDVKTLIKEEKGTSTKKTFKKFKH
jgi:hypothetical protein